MWILTLIPEWAIHLLLTCGILGTIIGFALVMIPIIKNYALPIQITSLLVLSLGLYLEGGLANSKEWQLKMKQAEIKAAKLEAEAAKLNVELQNIIVERDNLLGNKQDTIIKYIDKFKDREVLKIVEGPERVRIEEVIKYVENCPVPKEFIDAHNEAARMNKGKK